MATAKRVAYVTGGSRGIGEAIVQSLAAADVHVVAVARNKDKLDALVASLVAAGRSAEATVVDIADSAQLTASIEQTIEKHGRLDILVNNAGITRDGLFMRMDDKDFDDVLATNLRSAFVACRAAARSMIRAKWGRIINISSVSGIIGNAGQVNYAASKAGLIGLTKSIARELAGKQVTANCVAPGFTTTDMTDVLPPQIKENVVGLIPLRRFGSPADVAAAVAFLAGESAGYITGQVLAVDGGMSM
ncbi:MAG: 3-oxoacyl-[acyl-carrier-protein] reductase [Phycisphaerales bacterium]|nr:3-oxoacyl-[acyl-carrier-protein] reductase [Phycisphaerales bacterium]